MSKKRDKQNLIITVVIIIAFLFFLISIPKLINTENSNFNSQNKITKFGQNSDYLEEKKYKYIAQVVINGLKDDIITYENDEYIKELIINNKIGNRDNSIGQEIIYFYENNKKNIAKKIATNFLEDRLNRIDLEEDRRWRNEILYLIDKDNNIHTLYEKMNILTHPNNAKIIAIDTINISPYEYQIYNITLNNNSNEIITINILENKNLINLSKYTNIENQNNYKEINSYFIESKNISYQFKFMIWS